MLSKLLGVKNIVPFRLNVNCKIIPCSNEVKLLGITVDNELKSEKHVEDFSKKPYYKLHALKENKRILDS